MRFGSLFAGIGGIDLGLERAGMQCAWQCEINEYATKVLEKHWPDVARFRDVREVGRHNLEPVDLICGGFPCQDVSSSGNKSGINGAKSGLWLEFARIIREIRPRYVIVENVSALLHRGMGKVLGDLSSLGFDAEWETLPAWWFGYPHQRSRTFIVAYPNGQRKLQPGWCFEDKWRWTGDRREAINWVLSCGGVLRSTDGVSAELERVGKVGNAVVPQVAQYIGERIMASVLNPAT